MKIAYITSGAAGMYCGSCMKDNTLAAALCSLGHDCLLIPTYTPIRTDEADVSEGRVFFGGINVYLQQHSWLFRHTPRLLDRLLDRPALLRWVSRSAAKTDGTQLGGLTISMLRGTHGKQRKEVRKLVDWLSREFRPDAVVLSNVLISGLVPELKRAWNGPVLGALQGDDIFLESLLPADRDECIRLIRNNAADLDGFIATSQYYADFMSGYLGVPRERMHVVHPGINLKGHGVPDRTNAGPTVGYFARICPEKGFGTFVDACRAYAGLPDAPRIQIRVAGWLGERNRPFFEEQMARLGQNNPVEHVDCPTHADKIRFLQSLDILSVPTVYHEPKGIYILEALANGVPVVQPAHGSFPELIEATGGGVLVPPNDPRALALAWRELLTDANRRKVLADAGRQTVWEQFTAEKMALRTLDVLGTYHEKYHPLEAVPS